MNELYVTFSEQHVYFNIHCEVYTVVIFKNLNFERTQRVGWVFIPICWISREREYRHES